MPRGGNAPNSSSRDLNGGSEDETAGAGPSGQGKTQRIAKGARSSLRCERSSRCSRLMVWDLTACDRCRKSKSKCEPSPNEGEPCKSCAALGLGEFLVHGLLCVCGHKLISTNHLQNAHTRVGAAFPCKDGVEPLTLQSSSELPQGSSQGVHPDSRASFAPSRKHVSGDHVVERPARTVNRRRTRSG